MRVPDPRNFFQNRALAIALVFVGAVVAAMLGSRFCSARCCCDRRGHVRIPVPHVAGYITYGFGVLVFVGFVSPHAPAPARPIRPAAALAGGDGDHAALGGRRRRSSPSISASRPTYTVTYGTLAGVIITLMFFYLTGATIIFGAEVNAALDRLDAPALSCEVYFQIYLSNR